MQSKENHSRIHTFWFHNTVSFRGHLLSQVKQSYKQDAHVERVLPSDFIEMIYDIIKTGSPNLSHFSTLFIEHICTKISRFLPIFIKLLSMSCLLNLSEQRVGATCEIQYKLTSKTPPKVNPYDTVGLNFFHGPFIVLTRD